MAYCLRMNDLIVELGRGRSGREYGLARTRR